ncbi:hypothetical protein PH210_23815 [Paenibacillus sp. BSR1-1]|uniref:hypothetical protein n=1 Tax=Paenibacillus sp. BSR1-1 TaxID=3020845 RepID=UPI0025B01323|nr:hypothetical protein [Paenibacillus sp. BSR1-1]MDN3019203.1 hypothetical protein [Paenibacillus sp. BSR1-1]
MSYFILYFTDKLGFTDEYYLKGKSMADMINQIGKYTDGNLATSKELIITHNAEYSFLREISLDLFPHFSKKDFGMINEAKCYNYPGLI